MTKNSEAAREAIRDGTIQCPCRQFMLTGHRGDCLWLAAVELIYREERKEEKDSGRHSAS